MSVDFARPLEIIRQVESLLASATDLHGEVRRDERGDIVSLQVGHLGYDRARGRYTCGRERVILLDDGEWLYSWN